MRFSLTIHDATEAEISAFLSRSSLGSTAIINGNVPSMPSTSSAPSDDEESGETNNNAPGVDSAGIPWDDRIHSKNKALNSDGTWRKKRNVDAATVAAVEAELRGGGQQQMTMPTPPQSMPMQMPTPPQHQQSPMHMPQHMMQPAPGSQPMQMPGTMTMPTPPQSMPMQMPTPPQHQPQQQFVQLDFNGFMGHLTAKMQQKDATGAAMIDANYLVTVIQRLNAMMQTQFNVITDIVGNQMAINNAIAIINGDGRW